MIRSSVFTFILGVALLYHQAPLRAQYTDLATNPMSLLGGTLKFVSEHPVSPFVSLEPQVSYLLPANRFWSLGFRSRGVRIGLATKLYLTGDEHQGWYLMPYARYSQLDFENEGALGSLDPNDRDLRQRRLTLGLGGGYKWIAPRGLLLGASLGFGRSVLNDYRYADGLDEGDRADPADQPWWEGAIAVYGRLHVGLRLRAKEGKEKPKTFFSFR